MQCHQPPPPFGILVTNDEYDYSTNLRPLPGATEDAKRIKNTLESQLHFKVSLLKNASKEDIEDIIQEKVATAAVQPSEVWFYYSGHGSRNRIIMRDGSGMEISSVVKQLLRARRHSSIPVIVLLDCCRTDDDLGTQRFMSSLDSPCNILMGFSTSPGCKAWEDGSGGYWTHKLCESLENATSSSFASLQGILREVAQRVESDSAGTEREQKPEIRSFMEDRVFIRSIGMAAYPQGAVVSHCNYVCYN